MELVDITGRPVRIGAQIGRKGGEGCVFQVVSDPGIVAKVFHDPPSTDKESKLLYMKGLVSKSVSSMCAWPKSPLWNSQRKLVGFTMPIVSGSEVHELYNPKQRQIKFPKVEWNHLVRVARNCSAAFDEIHSMGAVIGDVNEGNILVKENCKVYLIDCDSYPLQRQDLDV
jgi:DNA-binding helix-hairpin-helix protein with protein kinase domain